MTEIVIPYAPRAVFLPYHRRWQRWSLTVAHRRAGKTVAHLNDLLRRALLDRKTNPRYGYIAPYREQAKHIAWDYLLHYSQPVRDGPPNVSELQVTLLNGAKVRLYGADNADAIVGAYFDGVVLDEPALMRPSVWQTVVRPMLADRKGWASWIGTPRGHNLFYEMRNYARDHPEEWYHAELRASQTGILTPDELAEARRTMSEDAYNQEFECDFEAAIQGAIWGKELRAVELEGRVTEEAHYDTARPLYTAWDLGRDDATAIWWWQTLPGEVRVFDYYESSFADLEHYVTVLDARPYPRAEAHYLPHDARAKVLATKRSVYEQLRARYGFAVRVLPALPVQDTIESARVMLKRTVFHPRCYDGLEALKQYVRAYDEDARAYRNTPAHNWASHAADAFRMMSIAWRELSPQEVKKAKKSSFPTFDDITRNAPPASVRRYRRLV